MALALGSLLAASACSDSQAQLVHVIRLEQMRPRPEARIGVFLNEALVFHFSGDVDGSSVTRENLVVRGVDDQVLASGSFEIDGRRVIFVPDLGRARDLSDGGFKPGTRYEVLVRGFPAPDGIRSVEGWPLAQSARFSLETAELSEPRGQMFDDRTPAVGAALRIEKAQLGTVTLGRNNSLELTCPEPLDPSTLVDGEFVLLPVNDKQEPIPLDPLLVSNSHEQGARLELRPRRILSAGRYYLRPRDQGGLGRQPVVSVRDFGGNQVWYQQDALDRVPIVVLDPAEERPQLPPENFLDDDLRSPLVVPDVDGSAHWKDNGLITVQFPRIAGVGTDGFCSLERVESRVDIHATGLEVPKGSTVQLLSVPGLVVVRAQGKLTIAGKLLRRAGDGPLIARSFQRGEAISAWLSRAQQSDPNWTVIVAGGDLVIDGEIDIDGPLLLAAGGRIRIVGRVRAQKNELWLVGEGGGGDINPAASRPEMRLDPPFLNPLVEPLTYAVLSSPMQPVGGVSRWVRAHVQGEARNGSYSVSYLPPDLPIGAPFEEWRAVEQPSDLLESNSLRILFVLHVYPHKPREPNPGLWYPPVIDDVRLIWEP